MSNTPDDPRFEEWVSQVGTQAVALTSRVYGPGSAVPILLTAAAMVAEMTDQPDLADIIRDTFARCYNEVHKEDICATCKKPVSTHGASYNCPN